MPGNKQTTQCLVPITHPIPRQTFAAAGRAATAAAVPEDEEESDPDDDDHVEHEYAHDDHNEDGDLADYDPAAPAALDLPFASAKEGERIHTQDQLKQMCHRLGVSDRGTKLGLAARVLERTASGVVGVAHEWKLLTKIESSRRPVVGGFDSAAGRSQPTNMKGHYVADAFNYEEEFARPKCTVPDIPFAGEHGQPEPNLHGEADCGLSAHAAPMQFFELFLPPSYRNQLTKWTNNSAVHQGMGATCHMDYKPLTSRDVDMQLGIMIKNGLSPERNHYSHFKDTAQDPFGGNTFVADKFTNGYHKAQQFMKSFATCPPSNDQHGDKEKDRTHKTRGLSDLVMNVTRDNWCPGKNLSLDEMSAGFQGKDGDKAKIKFKKEGDGYLADTIAQGGKHDWATSKHEMFGGGAIALAWIWRHADKSKNNASFSPLHNRCFKLFATLDHDYHHIWFDNLFTTVAFFRHAYVHYKLLCSGVARKNQVPSMLSMEAVTSDADLLQIKGTVKAAVLHGDSLAPFLLGATVYDNKPVRFLSYTARGVWWIEKIKHVWDRSMHKKVPLKFLRLNINDDYNTFMGYVDQVRPHCYSGCRTLVHTRTYDFRNTVAHLDGHTSVGGTFARVNR